MAVHDRVQGIGATRAVLGVSRPCGIRCRRGAGAGGSWERLGRLVSRINRALVTESYRSGSLATSPRASIERTARRCSSAYRMIPPAGRTSRFWSLRPCRRRRRSDFVRRCTAGGGREIPYLRAGRGGQWRRGGRSDATQRQHPGVRDQETFFPCRAGDLTGLATSPTRRYRTISRTTPPMNGRRSWRHAWPRSVPRSTCT